VRLLRRWGAPTSLGRGLNLLGELRGDDGLDDLREAVDLLTPTSAAVDLARARCALGSRRQVEDEEAVPLLLEASRTAEERGADGVLHLTCAELERRGHPFEARQEGVRRLSSTERQILQLTADGMDVHEVAQCLFVTPGTVRAVLEEAHPNGLPEAAQVSLKSAGS